MFNTKKDEDIETLSNLCAVYQEEIHKQKKLIDELNELYSDIINEAPVKIDFDKMNVVSVERTRENKKPATLIGYLDENCVGVQEWVITCSSTVHNKIIEEFTDYLNNKAPVMYDKLSD